jgi:hypothetical protein
MIKEVIKILIQEAVKHIGSKVIYKGFKVKLISCTMLGRTYGEGLIEMNNKIFSVPLSRLKVIDSFDCDLYKTCRMYFRRSQFNDQCLTDCDKYNCIKNIKKGD